MVLAITKFLNSTRAFKITYLDTRKHRRDFPKACSQTRDFRRLACGNNNEADFQLGSFLQELVPPWDPRLCPATQSRLLMRNYPYGGDRGVNELSRCLVSPRSFLIHTKMKRCPFPWVVESPRPLRHIWTSERLVFLPFRFSVSVSPMSFFT